MTVVLFSDSRVGVSKVFGHDEERHARHDSKTGPRVAQAVELVIHRSSHLPRLYEALVWAIHPHDGYDRRHLRQLRTSNPIESAEARFGIDGVEIYRLKFLFACL